MRDYHLTFVSDDVDKMRIFGALLDAGMSNFVITEDISTVAENTQVECNKTEDVQPVVHGKWVGDEEYEHMYGYYEAYKCSNCGCGVGYTSKYPYCPECGAKMKNGESEEERMKNVTAIGQALHDSLQHLPD